MCIHIYIYIYCYIYKLTYYKVLVYGIYTHIKDNQM